MCNPRKSKGLTGREGFAIHRKRSAADKDFGPSSVASTTTDHLCKMDVWVVKDDRLLLR